MVPPLKAPTLTHSFMRPWAVGLTCSLWPGHYSPCGREDAQSPMGLPTKLSPRSSSLSSPPDQAEVISDQMFRQSSPGANLPPHSLSFHHMESSQMQKNKLITRVSFSTRPSFLILIRALGSWLVAKSNLQSTVFLPLPLDVRLITAVPSCRPVSTIQASKLLVF